MLIDALVILTSKPTEDEIMILTKSLEYHVPTIDNLEKRVGDSPGDEEVTRDVGSVTESKLKGEHFRTDILMAMDFRVTRLMIIV
jgi:hypothetical protein